MGVDDVVGKNDREGFVADQFTRHQDGVPEAHGLLLADIGDMDHVGDLADDGQQFSLAAILQHFFQLVAYVEVILDGRLATAGYDDDLVATRGQRFFHAILNNGLVHQRHHFLGLRLGGR